MPRLFAIIATVLILSGTALAGGYVYDAYVASPDRDAAPVAFTVAEGERGQGVANQLEEAGIIDGTFFFKVYLRLTGTGAAFQPGTFTLQKGMSFSAIVTELTNAETEEVEMTVPEGFTLKQIGERVREALPHVTEEEWNAAVGGSAELGDVDDFVARNKPPGVDLEGYLFPDTYRFFADADARTVVAKMVGTMEERLGAESTAAGLTVHEILTLASIVEREVRSAEDMRYVADIFLSRLEIGMPLQADSTISYYLGKTSAELTLEDLRADEPFNTYTRVGLPPGPISNPGMNAINAVLRPIENPYLYFLTASDGTVIYAATFEEHVANKNRYLR
jgi:UPF0755 protein